MDARKGIEITPAGTTEICWLPVSLGNNLPVRTPRHTSLFEAAHDTCNLCENGKGNRRGGKGIFERVEQSNSLLKLNDAFIHTLQLLVAFRIELSPDLY
jgi:hypothetical protein